MSSSKLFTLYLSLLTLLLVGCHSAPKDVTEKDQLPQIWPDYVGVTIPVGIAPLNFSMADDEVTTIDVEVRGSKGGSLHANGDYADFDIDEWHRLLEANKGGQLTLTVCAEKNGQWTRYRHYLPSHPTQLRDIQQNGALSALSIHFRRNTSDREYPDSRPVHQLPYTQPHQS